MLLVSILNTEFHGVIIHGVSHKNSVLLCEKTPFYSVFKKQKNDISLKHQLNIL